jgi:hypothetical protein
MKIQNLMIATVLPLLLMLSGCEATNPTIEATAEPVVASTPEAPKSEPVVAPAVQPEQPEHCKHHQLAANGHDCIKHCAKHKGKKGKTCIKHCESKAMAEHDCAKHCAEHPGAKDQVCMQHCAHDEAHASGAKHCEHHKAEAAHH